MAASYCCACPPLAETIATCRCGAAFHSQRFQIPKSLVIWLILQLKCSRSTYGTPQSIRRLHYSSGSNIQQLFPIYDCSYNTIVCTSAEYVQYVNKSVNRVSHILISWRDDIRHFGIPPETRTECFKIPLL